MVSESKAEPDAGRSSGLYANGLGHRQRQRHGQQA
jgi:hypothetical protein